MLEVNFCVTVHYVWNKTILQSTFRDKTHFSLDAGRKLNIHKMFRRSSGHLLNVLCTFNLRPVPRGLASFYELVLIKELSIKDEQTLQNIFLFYWIYFLTIHYVFLILSKKKVENASCFLNLQFLELTLFQGRKLNF